MKYNHRKAEIIFEKKWSEEKEMFIAAGMTDEQINAIFEFERAIFNSERRYYENTVSVEDDDLLDRLGDTDMSQPLGRYFWLNVASPNVYQLLTKLPPEYIEAFTMYVYDGYTQEQISSILLKSQSSISRWIDKITEILKNDYFNA